MRSLGSFEACALYLENCDLNSYTFVTTEQFLVHFNLESLRDLPDAEQLADAGVSYADK